MPPLLEAEVLNETVEELRGMQRHRATVMQSRIRQNNRLAAVVAGFRGYHSGMKEKEREEKFEEARKEITQIMDGDTESDLAPLVKAHMEGIAPLVSLQRTIEKSMLANAKKLPVHAWVEHIDRRGFGVLSLAIVVGEAGNLSNYANPGKVWKRFGCAPHEFGGKNFMGATWKSGKDGKLPGEEWEKFGYSPRRRSIAYLIGEGLIKQNASGPYRARYDFTKDLFQKSHPDYPKQRCHRHGMLLATKMLLRDLWIEWHQKTT